MAEWESNILENTISVPLGGLEDVSMRGLLGFVKRLLRQLLFIAAGASAVFLIVLIKSKTTEDFSVEPYFFSYAIFVTVFEISRIASAMLYRGSFATLVEDFGKDSTGKSQEVYEPTVAFIIPCKNEERDIANTITQCFSAEYPARKIEVIVINDGSTDNTIEVLKKMKKTHAKLRVFDWPENQGKRWGMAAGFEACHSEIVIQLDSDSYIDPKTLRELIRPFRNPAVGAVCANGIPANADQNFITRMQTAYYFMSFNILKAAESTYDTVFCCSGCCSAYRKSAVMPVLYDWLSERFLGKPVTWGDDRALTSWLIKKDAKTVYNIDAAAYTIVPSTWRQLLKQQLRWKKSWIINGMFTGKFIWKKRPFVAFFYYFPLVLISVLTPVMTFQALIFAPLTKGILPLYHVAGIMLVTLLMVIYYRFVDRKNAYWAYLFPWALLNLFILSFMLVWALFKIQDRGWGTR